MRKNRIKWGIVAILSVFLFFIAVIITAAPKSYRKTEGPSTATLNTEGVFIPGGYVKFKLSLGIKSLKGYYKGSVNTYALSSDDIDQNRPLWQETGFIPVGRQWGGSMSGSDKSAKTFMVSHKVDIPEDESLAGQEVIFHLSYGLTYPVFAGAAPGVNNYYFEEETKNVNEYVSIKLEDRTLTPEEIDWKAKMDGPIRSIASIITLISVFVGLYAVIRFIFPSKNAKN